MILQAALYRLIAELACIAGVIAAAILAYHDKSAWVWGWFLLFAFANMVTGSASVKSGEESKSANT